MDSDTLKVFTAIAAVALSAGSAIFAYRVHLRSRTDAFEALKNTVARLVAENEQTRMDYSLKVFVARDRLNDAKNENWDAEHIEAIAIALEGLDAIEPMVAHENFSRNYTIADVEGMPYSEDALKDLRKAERIELQLKHFFGSHSANAIFDLAL